jgi:hypothetical protein
VSSPSRANPRFSALGEGNHESVPAHVAAVCGLLAPLTYGAALLFGGLLQRDAFSNANDSISDLGADTAGSPWLYNRLGTNLTGILIVVFALGLWRALSPDVLGRVGAGMLVLQGITLFLEGFFPLDCQGINAGCENTSWQSEGHRWVSRGADCARLFVAFALIDPESRPAAIGVLQACLRLQQSPRIQQGCWCAARPMTQLNSP